MFWKFNSSASSQIETILAKENVTLREVMDEDDILNECKVQNKSLIDFLIKPENLQELVTLTTTEPASDLDERSRFKYPNLACELLTCDIPQLNEQLAGNEALLAKLYSFLDKEPPLNPLLASFFSKIMAVLIAKKAEQNWLSYQFTCLQVLDFLKAKENFVQLLLNHLGTSAIMDLTLKLMTQVGGVEIRQNILNYLDSQRIIQKLIGLLDPKVDVEKHHNVAQLLCDFIQVARDNQRNSTERNDPDPLLNTLESPETISLLLDHTLVEDKCESSIVGCIQVLLELLDVNKSSIPKYDFPNSFSNTNYDDINLIDAKQKIIESTTKVILKRLKDFHNLLLDPPKKEPIITTVGTLNPPLGKTRLQVTKLLAALINSGSPELCQEIISLGTMSVLIDLFFAFPWNNFLHTQVQACISAALNSPIPSEQGDNIALSKHLLVNCKLVERILNAWKENEEIQSEKNGVRQGYMGHLINIANTLVNLCSDGPLGIFLKENAPDMAESLNDFKETTLKETNKTQDKLLGGVYPHTSNEDGDDYADIPFPSSGIGQQNFNEYQMQQLSPNFYDAYGYNDDDFKDGDDALQTIEHRTGMNFDLSEGDYEQQKELFKQVCAKSINAFNDSLKHMIEDDKVATFPHVINPFGERNNSSDSEEDTSPQELNTSPINEIIKKSWNSSTSTSETPVIMEDPWGNPNNENASSPNWADFSSAVFVTSFEGAFAEPKKTTEIENDLKVENIEIEAKESPKKDSIDIAQEENNEIVEEKSTSVSDTKVVDINVKENEQKVSGNSELSSEVKLPEMSSVVTEEVIEPVNKEGV